jgi:hypothetical protein
MNEMNYNFYRKRFYARKREENEKTEYPDLSRAANEHDMNVSF